MCFGQFAENQKTNENKNAKYYAQSELTLYIILFWTFHTFVHVLSMFFYSESIGLCGAGGKKSFFFGFTAIDLILFISCMFFGLTVFQIRLVVRYKTKIIAALFVILILCSISNIIYCVYLRSFGAHFRKMAKRCYAQAVESLRQDNFSTKWKKEEAILVKKRFEAILEE